jgi:hypothetical protein
MPSRSPTEVLNALTTRGGPGARCCNRLFEWCATAMMIGIAVCLVATPKTLEMGAFRFMTEARWSAAAVAWVFGVFGMLRVAALYANGHWQPWGARARMAGSMVAALMWFQMMIALALLTNVTGTLSIGIPVYIVLTVGELFSCYRAAADEIRRDIA